MATKICVFFQGKECCPDMLKNWVQVDISFSGLHGNMHHIKSFCKSTLGEGGGIACTEKTEKISMFRLMRLKKKGGMYVHISYDL